MSKHTKQIEETLIQINKEMREEFIDEFLQKLKFNKDSQAFEIAISDVEKFKPKPVETVKWFDLKNIILGYVIGIICGFIILVVMMMTKVYCGQG